MDQKSNFRESNLFKNPANIVQNFGAVMARSNLAVVQVKIRPALGFFTTTLDQSHVKQPFDDPEWVFELKYDGFRALYYIEDGRSWFVSRNGNHLGRFDDLCRQLALELD